MSGVPLPPLNVNTNSTATSSALAEGMASFGDFNLGSNDNTSTIATIGIVAVLAFMIFQKGK